MAFIENIDVSLGEYKALDDNNKEFLVILDRLASLESMKHPLQYSVKVD